MVLDITKPHIWVVNHGYIYITQCNFFFVFYDFDKTSIENKKIQRTNESHRQWLAPKRITLEKLEGADPNVIVSLLLLPNY